MASYFVTIWLAMAWLAEQLALSSLQRLLGFPLLSMLICIVLYCIVHCFFRFVSTQCSVGTKFRWSFKACQRLLSSSPPLFCTESKNVMLCGWSLAASGSKRESFCFSFVEKCSALSEKENLSSTVFDDHLVEIDGTSWLPQRHVIYEHVLGERLIYRFHKYRWFVQPFVTFMSCSVLEALAINTPTNNKVVPACQKYSTKMVWFQKYLTNNR